MKSNIKTEKLVLLYVPIRYLKLTDKAKLTLINLQLNYFNNKYEKTPFQKLYGSLYTDNFLTEPCFRYLGNIEHLKTSFSADENNLLTIRINNALTVFINVIWLVKDNSVNLRKLVLAGEKFTISDHKLLSFTKANGDTLETELNQNELNKVLYFFNKITPLVSNKEIDQSSIPLKDKGIISTESFSTIHNSLSRFNRAFDYVIIARTQSSAIPKIASMISACECLFTIRGESIGAQLKRRIPKYIGESCKDKSDIIKLINKTYDIRSRYLHGGNISKKYNSREQIIPLAIDLDLILRKIFTKIIKTDSEYFTSPEGFKKLLIKLEPKKNGIKYRIKTYLLKKIGK